MRTLISNLKRTVTELFLSSLVFLNVTGFAMAQTTDIDLFEQLKSATPETYKAVENQIRTGWTKSGSSAVDLLLERAQDAMQNDDLDAALEHLTAATDHAPEFAQGWNLLATVYFRRDLYGPAIDSLERALAINPNHFDAMTGLAVILDELGYAEDALEAYSAVRTIHPHRENISTAIERLEKQVRGQEI